MARKNDKMKLWTRFWTEIWFNNSMNRVEGGGRFSKRMDAFYYCWLKKYQQVKDRFGLLLPAAYHHQKLNNSSNTFIPVLCTLFNKNKLIARSLSLHCSLEIWIKEKVKRNPTLTGQSQQLLIFLFPFLREMKSGIWDHHWHKISSLISRTLFFFMACSIMLAS